jgi:hypothetical protein
MSRRCKRRTGSSKDEWDARCRIAWKGEQEYWNVEQLCQQLRTAIKIFDQLFPYKQGLFILDNSSANGGFDALALRT